MIITLTPNPSIDATLNVDAVARGEVVRATDARREAGGKGINVANAVALAGKDTLAIAPCGPHDPFISAVERARIPFAPVPIQSNVRTNTALTEPDGTTTKINERGAELSGEEQRGVEKQLLDHARNADAAVLAGSLPPGAAPDSPNLSLPCARLRRILSLLWTRRMRRSRRLGASSTVQHRPS